MSVVISGHGIVNQDVRFTPKSEHLQHRARLKEFALCQKRTFSPLAAPQGISKCRRESRRAGDRGAPCSSNPS